MEIQWEKLSDRLQSKSLKCLLCNVMKQFAESPSGALEGFIHCTTYMSYALATDDDEAFTKDGETLMKSLDKFFRQKLTEPISEEIEAYLKANHDYIRDRTREILERATECPEFKTKRR